MKLLLYCTRQKPYLLETTECLTDVCNKYFTSNNSILKNVALNGKIVAECDFEVEEINRLYLEPVYVVLEFARGKDYHTKTMENEELLMKNCLTPKEIDNYLLGENGYAIHIKNLNIFDKPRELSDYYIIQNENANPIDIEEDIKTVKKAPQNMMYCWDFIQEYRIFKKKIIISIHPEYLFKILNGEKTIEIRKKVLKECLNDK